MALGPRSIGGRGLLPSQYSHNQLDDSGLKTGSNGCLTAWDRRADVDYQSAGSVVECLTSLLRLMMVLTAIVVFEATRCIDVTWWYLFVLWLGSLLLLRNYVSAAYLDCSIYTHGCLSWLHCYLSWLLDMATRLGLTWVDFDGSLNRQSLKSAVWAESCISASWLSDRRLEVSSEYVVVNRHTAKTNCWWSRYVDSMTWQM